MMSNTFSYKKDVIPPLPPIQINPPLKHVNVFVNEYTDHDLDYDNNKNVPYMTLYLLL